MSEFADSRVFDVSGLSLAEVQSLSLRNTSLLDRPSVDVDLNEMLDLLESIGYQDLMDLVSTKIKTENLAWMKTEFGQASECTIEGSGRIALGTGLGIDLFVPGGTAIRAAGALRLAEEGEDFFVYRGRSGMLEGRAIVYSGIPNDEASNDGYLFTRKQIGITDPYREFTHASIFVLSSAKDFDAYAMSSGGGFAKLLAEAAGDVLSEKRSWFLDPIDYLNNILD